MTDDTITLSADAVEQALEHLEAAQKQGEISLSHDEVRPSVYTMAHECQDAYRLIVEAHPDYELTTEAKA